jgi:hypothetical protein
MIVPPFQSRYIIYNDSSSKYKGVNLHFFAKGNAGDGSFLSNKLKWVPAFTVFGTSFDFNHLTSYSLFK